MEKGNVDQSLHLNRSPENFSDIQIEGKQLTSILHLGQRLEEIKSRLEKYLGK